MSNPIPRPAKAMSSRLMTMKFMQRAAASTPPSIPQSQSQTQSTQPFKRQKITKDTTLTATPPSDLQLIRSGLDEEESKVKKAVESLEEEGWETKWVLSTVNREVENEKTGLRVVKAGWDDIDQDVWMPTGVGRRSFGKFNGELDKPQKGTSDGLSSSSKGASEDSDVYCDESDDPSGTRELIHTAKEDAAKRDVAAMLERKQNRNVEKGELACLAKKRRSKEVKLNTLSSISGGGGGTAKPAGGKSERVCYGCGEKGHERRNCPRPGMRLNNEGRGSSSKRSRSLLDY